MSEVTRILSAIEQGDPSAAEQLLPLVYDELRKLAALQMAHDRPGETLNPTALVHEAYLRLVGDGAVHRYQPTTVIAGGVFVAAGNVDGDNRIDLIVGLGSGAKSKVFVYEDSNNADTTATLLKKSTPIYGTTFKGGIRVAAADLNGDGKAEVLTTAGAGLSPYRLRVLNGLTLTALDAFFSQAPDFTDARFVAVARLLL